MPKLVSRESDKIPEIKQVKEEYLIGVFSEIRGPLKTSSGVVIFYMLSGEPYWRRSRKEDFPVGKLERKRTKTLEDVKKMLRDIKKMESIKRKTKQSAPWGIVIREGKGGTNVTMSETGKDWSGFTPKEEDQFKFFASWWTKARGTPKGKSEVIPERPGKIGPYMSFVMLRQNLKRAGYKHTVFTPPPEPWYMPIWASDLRAEVVEDDPHTNRKARQIGVGVKIKATFKDPEKEPPDCIHLLWMALPARYTSEFGLINRPRPIARILMGVEECIIDHIPSLGKKLPLPRGMRIKLQIETYTPDGMRSAGSNIVHLYIPPVGKNPSKKRQRPDAWAMTKEEHQVWKYLIKKKTATIKDIARLLKTTDKKADEILKRLHKLVLVKRHGKGKDISYEIESLKPKQTRAGFSYEEARLLRFIQKNKTATPQDVARHFKIKESLARTRLKKLTASGFVEKIERGEKKFYQMARVLK